MPPSTELFSTEAETGFLACLIQHSEDYHSLAEGLRSADFMGVDQIRVFRGMEEAVADKNTPSLPHILEYLRLKGYDDTIEYVSSLPSISVSIPEARGYAKVVRNLSVNRRLTHTGAKFIELGRENRDDSDASLAEAETHWRKLIASRPEPERSPRPDDIIRRLRSTGIEECIPINFSPKLNDITGGLLPGTIWVVGGFSSTGKSAFGVNMAVDAILARKRVAIFSTEMTQEQYLIRLISAMSGVPQKALRDNIVIGQGEQQARLRAEAELSASSLYVYDTIAYLPAIVNECVKLKNNDGLDLVIIDFIQNVYKNGDEVKDARESIITFQNDIAKKLSCAVVVFSQISNAYAQYDLDAKSDKNFYTYKGSGAIRDAADVGLILRRDRIHQSPILNVSVQKNRSGELGEIYCTMELPTGRIYETEEAYPLGDEEE